MKNIATLFFFLMASAAVAGEVVENKRYNELGECMAFIAVDSGVDGKKSVHPDTAKTISAIGAEFMFEASMLGYDDNIAQTFVVEKLQAMNLQTNEMGSGSLRQQYGEKCREVAIGVIKALQTNN